jgi:hypothetical protein
VTYRSDLVFRSYRKTAAACLALLLTTPLLALYALYWLPKAAAAVLATLSVLVACGAGILACASAVVLVRYKRVALAAQDLFLELNRSREPAAIKASPLHVTSRSRRWLAFHLLGHEFVVGDLVEIKTWAEIRPTLDEHGCLEQMPFMPEMLPMCGQRARVFRCMHRLFDYRKTRRMRHMRGTVLLVGTMCDGWAHGGCEAACHTIWKTAWLRRVEPPNDIAGIRTPSDRPVRVNDVAVLQFGTRAPRFTCQLTQLNAASEPIGEWSAANFLRPLTSGNVAPAAFIIGWMTDLFNSVQHLRQGVGFPAFEMPSPVAESCDEPRLRTGDKVVVRSSAEIRATLNDQLIHRGMGFETDMLKHCGRQYCIQAEVKRLIDIVTGEMRTMKTPAYILRNVHFSGERQLFNAQYEPLFWRAVWLRQDGD